MVNNEKLSLFRKGDSVSTGFVDISVKQTKLFFEPIDNFNIAILKKNEMTTDIGFTIWIRDTNWSRETSQSNEKNTHWRNDSTLRSSDIPWPPIANEYDDVSL